MVRGGGRVGGVIGGRSYGRPYVVAPRISPRIIGYGAYRPYYYYRPGISIGFYAGFGYPYFGYGYGSGYYSYPYYNPYYGYPYPAYTYPYPYSTYPGYSTYPAYPSYPGYSTAQPYPQQGTVTAQAQPQPAAAYGGVRIEGAPRDAQVYVDGHYAGLVQDFDRADGHLNLEAGTHDVEIRVPGRQPVGFDVNVPPNQTITVRVP